MATLMQHNGITGELVCYAPAGEIILRINEPDIKTAHEISNAVQTAYKKGWLLGRLDLQLGIERYMEKENR